MEALKFRLVINSQFSTESFDVERTPPCFVVGKVTIENKILKLIGLHSFGRIIYTLKN